MLRFQDAPRGWRGSALALLAMSTAMSWVYLSQGLADDDQVETSTAADLGGFIQTSPLRPKLHEVSEPSPPANNGSTESTEAVRTRRAHMLFSALGLQRAERGFSSPLADEPAATPPATAPTVATVSATEAEVDNVGFKPNNEIAPAERPVVAANHTMSEEKVRPAPAAKIAENEPALTASKDEFELPEVPVWKTEPVATVPPPDQIAQVSPSANPYRRPAAETPAAPAFPAPTMTRTPAVMPDNDCPEPTPARNSQHRMGYQRPSAELNDREENVPQRSIEQHQSVWGGKRAATLNNQIEPARPNAYRIEATEVPARMAATPKNEPQPTDGNAVRLIALQPEALPPVDNRANPFDVIEESGEIKVTVRRSKLMQTKMDIYRTAVVDPNICEIVQFSPRELSLIGRGIGSTHVTFWFEGAGQRPHTYLITVMPDEQVRKFMELEYQKLEDIIAELFPDSKIRLTVMADKLIVRGQAKDSEEAAQVLAMIRANSGGQGGGGGFGGGGGLASGQAARVLSDSEIGQSGVGRQGLIVINMLRVPGVQQVALKVKIAELNRSAARGFGVNVATNINFSGGANSSSLFIQSILGLANGTTGGPSVLANFSGNDVQVGFRYLQQHGVARLLSEPTLVTMSGTPATFVAGGEFAVPTIVGSAGLNAIATDFRSFGAIISFLPTVIDKDLIRLQVSPEFSQVNKDLSVGNTPGLNTRAASTTVQMREGQTFAIAGLLEDNMKTSNVGNLPFLYPFVGNRDATRNETELIILVTPELVHPMDPEEVPPLPGFDVTEPDNHQFYLKGRLEGNPTRDFRSTVWPRLRQRYNSGGTSMISGPFGHGQ